MIKHLLYFSILTTFVVIAWIALSIYNSHVASTIPNDVAIQISPIPATFDTKTIDSLKSNRTIDANLSDTIIFDAATSVQQTPTPTGIPGQNSVQESGSQSAQAQAGNEL